MFVTFVTQIKVEDCSRTYVLLSDGLCEGSLSLGLLFYLSAAAALAMLDALYDLLVSMDVLYDQSIWRIHTKLDSSFTCGSAEVQHEYYQRVQS